ncbi:MFS transporter [Microbispora siamensis]|uniref:MFS transporter n=1 Tax=Microbispora siamensis TaxID=564413 RepID=A0ABQ4GGK8_9ACTN|nr:MFS transporter [Microbispora siamensis]GIH60524.1 MFS transporter [Microbispora siamensis]
MRSVIPLVLLGLGSSITALDFTIVYVALPQIAREAGFSPYALQWVVSGYAVPFGGFLLLGGRLSDLLGRRRMFVAGMLLYGVASLLGGLASSPAPLICARALQGLGGAVLMPATLSLVVTMFAEGPARNRAMTVWAVCGAAGLSLGALLGGILTGALGWEAVFFVNVPLTGVGAVAALAVLTPDGGRRAGGFDLPGALTGTAGVTGLVFAVAQGPQWGWTSPGVLASAAAAAGLLAVFLVMEARGRDPLLPPRLLANRHTAAGAGVILVYGLTLQCVPYFLTLHFQDVLGYDALRSGLAFLGPTLAITAGNLAAERLIPRLGLRGTLILGIAVGATGTAVLAWRLSADGSYLGLLAGVVGFGLGAGLWFSTMFILASTGVAPREQGVVSGLSSTLLQAGSAAGLAVLVAVAGRETTGLTGEALRAATAGGLRSALLVAAVVSVAGMAVTTALRPAGRDQATLVDHA